jgi:hypothetical protein
VPRISAFYGVSIYMYHDEHGVPHFHAWHGGARASVAIETLQFLNGSLPPTTRGLVLEWAEQHREELRQNWLRARQGKALLPVEPLQ